MGLSKLLAFVVRYALGCVMKLNDGFMAEYRQETRKYSFRSQLCYVL